MMPLLLSVQIQERWQMYLNTQVQIQAKNF